MNNNFQQGRLTTTWWVESALACKSQAPFSVLRASVVLVTLYRERNEEVNSRTHSGKRVEGGSAAFPDGGNSI